MKDGGDRLAAVGSRPPRAGRADTGRDSLYATWKPWA